MPAVAIVGAQWGDEGKGKVVDLYTETADMVVRFGGGPNAGHTLVVGDEKIVVRLIPSGILRLKTQCVLAQGMVIDPASLVSELDELTRRGKTPEERLVVSDRAFAILPHHRLIDELRERGKHAIGTTKRGVGPCYEDKAARRGLPLGALRDLTVARAMVKRALEAWTPEITSLGGTVPSEQSVMDELEPLARRILPLLRDTGKLVAEAVESGKRVLLEGAQGTLLDLDHGTYPFVTSSTATAGGASVGTGLGPTRIDSVVGLVKAYTTRVGGGPFPTELNDAVGEQLRQRGAEFGSVTGRPRRTGWLDLPALRYAVRVNGLDGLALTKMDVMTGLDDLYVCTEYKVKSVTAVTSGSGSRTTRDFPIDELEHAEPVYTRIDGWKEELGAARTLDALPAAARAYIELVEKEAGCPVVLVSVGYRRDETITLRDPFQIPRRGSPSVERIS
jgi:adenylosuccinate synthase